MNIPAFWVPVAPLYALSALAALGLAFRAGSQGVALIVSTACAVAGVRGPCCTFAPPSNGFLKREAGTLQPNAFKSRLTAGSDSIGSA